MYCEKCGRKLEEGEEVCSFCNEKNKENIKEKINIDGAKIYKTGLWLAIADSVSIVLFFVSHFLFFIQYAPEFVYIIFLIINTILYILSFVLYILTVVFMGVGLGTGKSKRLLNLSIVVIVFSTIIFIFAIFASNFFNANILLI